MSALVPSEYIQVEGTVPYVKVARVLCHGILKVSMFISKHRSAGSTQQKVLAALEIFKEVAQIAHCFNRLIRIALKEALKLEQEYHILGALPLFLSKLHALTNVDSSGHKPAVSASVSMTGVATKVALSTLSEGVNPVANPGTRSISYGYQSLTPENTGVSPLSKTQKKYKPPSDLCVKCKLTINDACIHLGTYQCWHPHCLRCQSCNKAAGVGSGTTQTSSHMQVYTSNFLYEPMSIENIPLLGLVPSVVYCTDHAWPTSCSGFLPVLQLEQYAYLLMVTLRQLYASLKDPTPATQTFGVCPSC